MKRFFMFIMLDFIFTYLLLHWDEAIVFPSYSTSLNGDPDAKIARPFVHLCAASAVHSALEVGLDNGIMTGGESCPSFIVFNISSKSNKKQIWLTKLGSFKIFWIKYS